MGRTRRRARTRGSNSPTNLQCNMMTPCQLETLEKHFALDRYPNCYETADLSAKLGLSVRQLQLWFAQRRLKGKKENAARNPSEAAPVPGSPMGEGAQSFTASSSRSNTATSPVGGGTEMDDVTETCDTNEVSSEDVTNLKSARGCFKWTTDMDGLMLEVLREDKNKGLKEDGKTYRNIVTKIKGRCGVAIGEAIVVNQLKALKDQMFLACRVLKKSGFGWNEVTKRIEAEPEVWIAMTKADEKYNLIRGKTLHHLELFKEIFDKDQATGEFAETAKEKVRRWEREKELTVDDVDEGLDANGTSSRSGGDTSHDTQGGSSSASEGSKREEAVESVIYKEISGVANAVKEIARALLSTSQRIWPEDEIVEAMKGLGLEGNDLLDAVDWLVAHPKLIGTFFAYPNDLRAVWLHRRMHGK